MPEHAMLLVFTRYPAPGRVKTRLIPGLGEAGAADMHRAMTTQTLHSARLWRNAAHGHAALRVYFDGGDAGRMAACFGGDLTYFPQGDGSLGMRMQRAFQAAFWDGATAVVLIGSDCPALGPAMIAQAFAALKQQEVVLGPTTDGGYYLIGLRQSRPELFPESTPWGTAQVFDHTVACLAAAGLTRRWACLPPLSDVDYPEDLTTWERHRRDPAEDASPWLSVVLPTLNEEAELAATLSSLQSASSQATSVEVIVVDGGSEDSTRDIAWRHGVLLLQSPPGRAQQMNQGAAVTRGELLLFLHGDTQAPPGYLDAIARCVVRPNFSAGAFRLQLRGAKPGLRWIALAANLRSRWLQRPYGDQGIFLRRSDFLALGGYRDLPVMEDLDLIQRLRRRGGRIVLAHLAAASSGRRWETQGLWRSTWRHQKMLLAWRLGLHPDKIRRFRP